MSASVWECSACVFWASVSMVAFFFCRFFVNHLLVLVIARSEVVWSYIVLLFTLSFVSACFVSTLIVNVGIYLCLLIFAAWIHISSYVISSECLTYSLFYEIQLHYFVYYLCIFFIFPYSVCMCA